MIPDLFKNILISLCSLYKGQREYPRGSIAGSFTPLIVDCTCELEKINNNKWYTWQAGVHDRKECKFGNMHTACM